MLDNLNFCLNVFNVDLDKRLIGSIASLLAFEYSVRGLIFA